MKVPHLWESVSVKQGNLQRK